MMVQEPYPCSKNPKAVQARWPRNSHRLNPWRKERTSSWMLFPIQHTCSVHAGTYACICAHVHTYTHTSNFIKLQNEEFISIFFLFNLLFYFIFLGVLSPWMSLYRICAWCPQKPTEDFESPGTVATHSCEPPCRGLKLNLCPQSPGTLRKQSARWVQWVRCWLPSLTTSNQFPHGRKRELIPRAVLRLPHMQTVLCRLWWSE